MCKKIVRVVLHVQSPAAAEVSPSAKLAPNKKQLAKQAAFCLGSVNTFEAQAFSPVPNPTANPAKRIAVGKEERRSE